MLSPRTLRLLLTLSARDKAAAEQEAAAAAEHAEALKRQEQALTDYVQSVANRRMSGVSTGYDMKSVEMFVATGVTARVHNDDARVESIKMQRAAFSKLAEELQRRDALEKSLKAVGTAMASLSEARDQASRPTSSREAGNTGRSGRGPPARFQVSNLHT